VKTKIIEFDFATTSDKDYGFLEKELEDLDVSILSKKIGSRFE
jgi:hypothetical protein